MKIIKRLFGSLLAIIVLFYVGLVIYAYWPTGIEEVPATELAGPDDQFVNVDGLALRYRTFGMPGPEKPNVVLLHGFGNSLQSFRLLAPLLADDFYVITLDMPGFGLSDKPVDYNYGNASQAATVIRFMEELNVERPVIGGHSLGGAVALRVALIDPDVSGLILMNPGIINTGVPAITKYLPFPFPRLSAKQFGNREFRESFLKTSFINPEVVTDEVMDDLMLAPQSEGYMSGSTAMMGFYEEAQEYKMLDEVQVPTVLLWGAMDRNKTEEELAQLRAGLQNHVLVRVENVGHYVHEEGAAASAAGLIASKDLWQ